VVKRVGVTELGEGEARVRSANVADATQGSGNERSLDELVRTASEQAVALARQEI
jgi:hypothetical protein